MNATLNPNVLQWARKKAGFSEETLAEKIGVQLGLVKEWETTGSIPLAMVEKLAEKTRTAFGFLFLQEPPHPSLPIADFRRIDASQPSAPSDELLDIIYAAQLKQNWYREYLISTGAKPLPFVGKASIKTPTKEIADDIRATLNIGSTLSATMRTWEEAWSMTIEATEESGILVLCAGYAGSFTQRTLSVEEFRGFALSDKYAPLIFVNGADAPVARLFTLAHEIAHIWIGETGISNLERTYAAGNTVETYCNSVAAEVLLPLSELRAAWRGEINDIGEVQRLSDKYKISKLVVARRAHDAGFFTEEKFSDYYRMLIAQAKAKKAEGGGGKWYINEKYQNSRKFSVTIIQEALAGRSTQREAMQLLGIKKDTTFRKYAKSLESGVEWPIY
ncbi:MAG TPA: ImmA/IrrE family metallo-endopeptidase [Verrucomicrobiae bacterium]|jgi:Zn-dependent peptidase ImmA (M78 family)|nr:ImmA/IrrE family metallo-endopeptidase [Verrucomicrobiae bacterium]